MTGPFELWLRGLAEEAESRQWPGSRDLITLWERIDDAERLVREWPTVWQRFWDARCVDQLRAAAIALTERRPPDETRGAVHLSRGFAVKCEVVAVSLGDHVAREVIVLSCDGLPMHGSD